MRSTLVALAVLLLPASASAFQVRADRPRLMLSNGNGFGTSLETFKQRCTSDPAYMQRCQGALANGGGLFPAANRAAAYLVSGDPARCGEAFTEAQAISQDQPGQPDGHAFISNNGRTLLQVAMVRDWCDAALDGEQKQWLEDRIVTYADWYIANDGANEVFGNDIYNVWNAVAFAGLSLAGTAQDQKAQSYLTAADAKWKTVIFPSLAHSGDWWPEGMTYVQPAIASTVWYAAAWSTATDEDIFAWAKTNAKDIYNGYIHFHAYATRPDSHYVYFGDTSDSKQSVALFSRYLVDMLTLGTKSPLGQAFSLEIEQMVDKYYDYSGADGWLMAILRDAAQDGSATPRSTLPTARWHGQGSNDVAILRSGWGKADTFVMLSCGDYLSAHQHYEAGSFQIFRHSQLTGTTGYYDAFDTDHWLNYYSQHSVHANVLSVYQPGEFFPTLQSLGDPSQNVNDGGQRVLRRDQNGTASPQPDLPTYLSQLDAPPYKNTGDIQTFEHTVDCHDYVACDVTAAYTSPGHETNGNTAKVNEVTRQFVFIKPDIIVVFDRVESTDPSYDKRFLLHALGAPDVQGNTYTITNGPGRLIGKTLLPADPEVSVINNFEVEGKAHPPQNAGKESGGTRLEISPKTEGARDYFLHVLRATDSADSAAPNATATEDDKNIILTLEHGGESWTVTFAKTGDLGGYIKAVSGGQTLCDQALGEFATIPNDGGAGGAGGSGGNGGSGANGADSGEEGGCGCRIDGNDAGGSAALLGAALAGLALHRRRRARAPQA